MCKPQRRGAAEPHTTAERRHQLRIESTPMHEFCAYSKNCIRAWLAARLGRSARGYQELLTVAHAVCLCIATVGLNIHICRIVIVRARSGAM